MALGQRRHSALRPDSSGAAPDPHDLPHVNTVEIWHEPRNKVRATFHLPAELLEECRDAVVHLSGPPVRLTLAALAQQALVRELARLRRKYEAGKRFPKRQSELRGGRPIGP